VSASKTPRKQYNLQNGTVGRQYDHTLSVPIEGFSSVRVVSIEGLESIGGLKFDQDSQTLSGVPENQGQHPLVLHIRVAAALASTGHPDRITRNAELLINPNPRSLWKDLPSDEKDEFWKPDAAQVQNGDGPQLMLAASKRGRSHANEGKFRDDDFEVKYVKETGWYILAVADGAGYATYSRRGSQLACQFVSQALEEASRQQLGKELEEALKEYKSGGSEQSRSVISKLLYETLGQAAFGAMKRIEAEAAEKSAQLRDFATTLLIGVSKKFPFGHFVGAFWVGDGGIAVLDLDGKKVKVLGESDSGEFAGQTRFLLPQEFESGEKVASRLRFGLYDRFTALVAMTDGVSDPKFETDKNLNDFEQWRRFWEDDLNRGENLKPDHPNAGEQLLAWLDFWSPGNHYDRTIAILLGE
jgi:hypothetical protein